MIGSFGNAKAKILFQTSDQRVQNFLDLKRDSQARFCNHEVINTKPKSEFIGPGLDKLSFRMELSAFHGVKPMTVINQLRTFEKNGEVGNFILGGRNIGKYKILSISENYGIITNRGGIATVNVEISMEEYQ